MFDWRMIRLVLGLSVASVGAVAAQEPGSTGDSDGGPPVEAYAEIARELAAWRAEIEDLDASLRLRRDRASERLRALDMQAEELQLLLDRERLTLADLERDRARDGARRESDAEIAGEVSDIVRETLDGLIERTERGIPFRRRERSEALHAIRNGLEQDEGSAEVATTFAQTWRFIEDELQLARSWGRVRLPLLIGGREMMVESFRLGLVALYYRTGDGEVGMTRGTGDGHDLVPLSGTAASEVQRLLDDAATRPPSDVYTIPVGSAP